MMEHHFHVWVGPVQESGKVPRRASLLPPDCRTGWCEFGHRAELINTNLLSAAITLTLQEQPPLPWLLPTSNNVYHAAPYDDTCLTEHRLRPVPCDTVTSSPCPRPEFSL